MKEEDWKLKFIGDNWKFLPDKEWKEKSDYDKLLYNIRRKNGKIERLKKEISDEKVLLRDLKKLRTKDFKRLVKHHKKFSPSFSYSLNFGGKYVEYKSGNYAETNGNNQWELNLRVGGKRKYIYIGTISLVSLHLDLLENKTSDYYLTPKGKRYSKSEESEGYYQRMKPNYDEEQRKVIKSKLEFYLNEPIKNLMIDFINKDGNLNSFHKKKIKGLDILFELFKSTSHYTPPLQLKPKKKGKRLGKLIFGKGSW